MTTVVFPRTDGDVILDLRELIVDGNLIPVLVAVDEAGAVKDFGQLLQFRDGGGHVEPYRVLIADNIGFVRNSNGNMQVSPEGV